MPTILDRIIADKRAEVAARRERIAQAELERRIADLEPCRPFVAAFASRHPRGIHVLAEVKKASPSAGLIRPDFDPVAIARIYQACGATAISVLTDERHFQGRLEYLTAVKQAVDLPVMRKEFIIDAYQVVEARAAGADAILLIADCLSTETLERLLALAAELGLGVLLEVYGAGVLQGILDRLDYPHAGVSLLGINNRDLASMTVDLDHGARLVASLERPVRWVAESGVRARSDVERLIAAGAHAVLIGQRLCEQPDIAAAFHELFG